MIQRNYESTHVVNNRNNKSIQNSKFDENHGNTPEVEFSD